MPQTVISSTAVNSDLSDIATALTGSLARDGQGGMTDVLPLDPLGFTYLNDTNTGMYRFAADIQRVKCAGIDILEISQDGIDVLAGSISVGGNTIFPIGIGPLPWSLTTPPSGWALCYGQPCTSAYAAYRALLVAAGEPYGTDGTDPLFPDMRGRGVAGRDDMGGSAANRLTATTMTPDGITLGAVGGTQTHTLTAGESAVLSYTSAVTDPGHTHDVAFNQSSVAPGSATNPAVYPSSGAFATSSEVTGITVSTTANAGGGAHNNVQPTLITNYIVYVGV